MTLNHEIPTGIDHIHSLSQQAVIVERESTSELNGRTELLNLIGVSLCAIYQAATCHRKCLGGSHVLESLAGRTYNLGAAGYHLITLGYYDEALSLVRNMGEIANLVALSVVDKDSISEWLNSDKKTRLRKFSPSKIRKLLKNKSALELGEELIYADSDWYSDLCENFVHVSPQTKPNFHNKSMAHVGSAFQEAGIAKAIEELAGLIGFIALLICRYFKYEDLFESISTAINQVALRPPQQV